MLFRWLLIIQYFLPRQLAVPYFIRTAHGQKKFLEVPFNDMAWKFASVSMGFSSHGKERRRTMNRKTLFSVVVLFCFFSGSALAEEGQLYLFKDQTFDSSPILQGVDPNGDCDQLFKVAPGKDVPDMRDFQYYFCEGMYTLRLDGSKGMTVTLFGNFFFNKEEGFLVLKKLDDQLLWFWI